MARRELLPVTDPAELFLRFSSRRTRMDAILPKLTAAELGVGLGEYRAFLDGTVLELEFGSGPLRHALHHGQEVRLAGLPKMLAREGHLVSGRAPYLGERGEAHAFELGAVFVPLPGVFGEESGAVVSPPNEAESDEQNTPQHCREAERELAQIKADQAVGITPGMRAAAEVMQDLLAPEPEKTLEPVAEAAVGTRSDGELYKPAAPELWPPKVRASQNMTTAQILEADPWTRTLMNHLVEHGQITMRELLEYSGMEVKQAPAMSFRLDTLLKRKMIAWTGSMSVDAVVKLPPAPKEPKPEAKPSTKEKPLAERIKDAAAEEKSAVGALPAPGIRIALTRPLRHGDREVLPAAVQGVVTRTTERYILVKFEELGESVMITPGDYELAPVGMPAQASGGKVAVLKSRKFHRGEMHEAGTQFPIDEIKPHVVRLRLPGGDHWAIAPNDVEIREAS